MNGVAKPLKSLRLQGGRWIERLSAWVHARCLSRQAQRIRLGLFSGCSRWLRNHPGSGLHQAHHHQGDRGRGHHLLRQHGGDLRGGLADGGMTVNLRMLRRIDQGEEVEVADGTVGGDHRGVMVLGKLRPCAALTICPPYRQANDNIHEADHGGTCSHPQNVGAACNARDHQGTQPWHSMAARIARARSNANAKPAAFPARGECGLDRTGVSLVFRRRHKKQKANSPPMLHSPVPARCRAPRHQAYV